MQVIDTDRGNAKPAQGRLARCADVPRVGAADDVASDCILDEPDLGGNDDIGRSRADAAADQQLIGERPVDVGGVEESHPEVERPRDHP